MPHLFHWSKICGLRLFCSIRVVCDLKDLAFIYLCLLFLFYPESLPFPSGVYKALFSALIKCIFIDCLMFHECLFKMSGVLLGSMYVPLIKAFWVYKTDKLFNRLEAPHVLERESYACFVVSAGVTCQRSDNLFVSRVSAEFSIFPFVMQYIRQVSNGILVLIDSAGWMNEYEWMNK